MHEIAGSRLQIIDWAYLYCGKQRVKGSTNVGLRLLPMTVVTGLLAVHGLVVGSSTRLFHPGVPVVSSPTVPPAQVHQQLAKARP